MNQAAVDTIAALPLDYWVEGCQCVVNAGGDLRTGTCPHHATPRDKCPVVEQPPPTPPTDV
jgi:hypothetical protein